MPVVADPSGTARGDDRPRTNVYVDGFNLYYSLKKTPYKWLDLGKLFSLLLPSYDIHRIRYFTANIKPPVDDPQGPARQQAYLSALESIPTVSIHHGKFYASKVFMRLVDPPAAPEWQTVQVRKMEEKGSDVNLATLMLVDAFEKDCDVSVLVSNDSDHVLPLRLLLSDRFNQVVGLVNPQDKASSRALMDEHPSFVRQIRQGLLAASQFPNEVKVGRRTLHRPDGW